MDRHSLPLQKPKGTHYSQFAPSPQLASYVACYWTITGGHGRQATKIRVLPDGCMDAIFDLNGGLRPMGVSTPNESKPKAFVTGASITPVVISLPESPLIVGIRFKPGGAVPFLRISAMELAETSAELDDLLPEFARLGTTLAGEANCPNRMVQALDRLLLEHLVTTDQTSGLTSHTIQAMTGAASSIRVNSLVQNIGVSLKTLERTLKHHTGLTPKRLCRTIRFISTIRTLTANPQIPLANLAHDLGFTDQAHFNREFKSMAGLSPTNWLKEIRDDDFLQYTPVCLS